MGSTLSCNWRKGSDRNQDNGSAREADKVEEIDLQPTETPSAVISTMYDRAVSTPSEVGGGRQLKDIMKQGRKEIRESQEKLNSSLNTPLTDSLSEAKILEKGSWLDEQKDIQGKRNVLPPIADGKRVKTNATAFNID